MKKALNPLLLKPLKLGEVKPTGWLKNQLITQLNGLSGHLDQFWPDIMDSGWIGGNAEGWERFPYWLDGVIPLAFQLESSDLIKQIEKYINYILDQQQNDGWFGPTKWGENPEYDPWPNMVLCKALIQYFEISGDKRIVPALLAYYHKLDEILDDYPLGHSWAQMRWMDGVWGIHWLIDYLKEDSDTINFLFSLAEKLQIQGYDWKEHFDNFFYVHFKKTFQKYTIKKGSIFSKKKTYPIVIYSKDIIQLENSIESQIKK